MSRKIPLAHGQKILPPPNRDQGDMTGAVQQLPMQQDGSEKIDVAMNIFAKPYQTALSVLSLLKHSGRHVGNVWLQFEPYGSQYDIVSPYALVQHLGSLIGERCRVFQPDYWLDLNAADPSRFADDAYRYGIRYQYAFEHSTSRRLFLMHNDVLVLKDVLGYLGGLMGDAVAVGHLGQCWNCPARVAELTREVMGCEPCGPERHLDFRPDYSQLQQLYALAHQRKIFARPYDRGFAGIFDAQPWPLPECRVNEWACLLDLEKTRPLCVPHGPVLPPGAYRQCGPVCLDIGVEWFRGMHARGMTARHANLSRHLKHWVGTGKVTARLYALAEENALKILLTTFPDYCDWLRGTIGNKPLGVSDRVR
ncbi:hypothetical protein [uncultured Desulfovibrio sp.]|uniref:hypothetical protein n=1 Tax=uncultured Desulfovibrio sp. TaxID=167968 RepID=UPI002603C674|nr:hypothetical protein [uncultured Desulfovibrio sp.]